MFVLLQVFWELFAGSGALSKAFEVDGWHIGLQMDVMIEVGLDLLHPMFLVVVIMLILEGRVVFSSGTVGTFFQIEQPEESFMPEREGFKTLVANANVHIGTRSECVVGAPWEKPTVLIANNPCIKALTAKCPCLPKTHTSGKSRLKYGTLDLSRSSVLARLRTEIARRWLWALSGHMSSWLPSAPRSIVQLLDESGFTPSGKRSPTIIVIRSSAGVEPTRSAPPQILPECLGPELHLQASHMSLHKKRLFSVSLRTQSSGAQWTATLASVNVKVSWWPWNFGQKR